MVAKYKCDMCGEKWKSINSSGSPKKCVACKKQGLHNTVKPYKYRKAKPEVGARVYKEKISPLCY